MILYSSNLLDITVEIIHIKLKFVKYIPTNLKLVGRINKVLNVASKWNAVNREHLILIVTVYK